MFKKCAALDLAKANDIANAILPKYEASLGNPPKGESFRECYNVKTLVPHDAWIAVYNSVKEEAVKVGIPL